ncbi:MAG: amidohydrolase family protein [Bryobacteraceae bacterium]|jgi:imidazolonepropionase-like amidohydrolase/ABC-type multidrug transport system permease subunit
MRAYLAEIAINLKLTGRDKMVLFFNYAFPLIFFFIFASLFHAEQGGAATQVVTMSIVIGILGNGLFGAGIRAVVDREANILRRFKVAPISAGPILVSSLVTGLLNYLPSALLLICLAHFFWGMSWPARPFSLLVYVSLGVLAFRAIGMMIAAVVNSMQESQILTQLLYFPMLFLSGATIPVSALPVWVQLVSQFIPATYVYNGTQAILGSNETLAQNWNGALALLAAVVVATFLGMKLFRWDKEDKISMSGKLWLVAVLGPFLLLGGWQAHTRESITKSKILAREVNRSRALLIRDAQIFVGNGEVIPVGSVLVRNGKIAEVYRGPSAPDAGELKAEVIEAAGKTLLPGLIDVHVHLGATGGAFPRGYDPNKAIPRELAAYLYSGVTAVKSVGDSLDVSLKARALMASGERLGAELFVCGPMFTAPGGHGTEYVKFMPPQIRDKALAQMVRLPKSPEEARQMVDALKQDGVDGIKAILETGSAGRLFNRMDTGLFNAVAAQAHADHLPIVVHTGDVRDVADALAAGADGIEHGSFRELIPDDLFARMKAQQTTYDPTLAVVESVNAYSGGSTEMLERPLVLQVGPASLIDATRRMIQAQAAQQHKPFDSAKGRANFVHAWRAGVILVTGTDSGNPGLLHGPALHRELQLWVDAGIPPAVALQAATYNAARLLRVTDRIGVIEKGRDATLLIVNGDPLKDIRQTESIQQVIFRGERVDRSDLFNDE